MAERIQPEKINWVGGLRGAYMDFKRKLVQRSRRQIPTIRRGLKFAVCILHVPMGPLGRQETMGPASQSARMVGNYDRTTHSIWQLGWCHNCPPKDLGRLTVLSHAAHKVAQLVPSVATRDYEWVVPILATWVVAITSWHCISLQLGRFPVRMGKARPSVCQRVKCW